MELLLSPQLHFMLCYPGSCQRNPELSWLLLAQGEISRGCWGRRAHLSCSWLLWALCGDISAGSPLGMPCRLDGCRSWCRWSDPGVRHVHGEGMKHILFPALYLEGWLPERASRGVTAELCLLYTHCVSPHPRAGYPHTFPCPPSPLCQPALPSPPAAK